MSDWMWFTVIILGLILGFAGWSKWVDANVKIEQIMREELDKNDDQNNSEDS